MLLISRLAKTLRRSGNGGHEGGDTSLWTYQSDANPHRISEEFLSSDGQPTGGGQEELETAMDILRHRLLPLAASPQHLQAFDSRHLCAILSSLAWMRHLLPPQEPSISISHEFYRLDCNGLDTNASSGGLSSGVAIASPWECISCLLRRASEQIHEASADDASRTLWALARLGGGRTVAATETANDLDDGELLEAFSQAAMSGAWEISVNRRRPLPFPGNLVPTILWAMSHSPAKHLGRHNACQVVSRMIFQPGSNHATIKGEGGNTAKQSDFPISPDRLSSSFSTFYEPLLIRSEVLQALNMEGLVTTLYAIGLMCGSPFGRETSSKNHQQEARQEETAATRPRVSPDVIEALCNCVLERSSRMDPHTHSTNSALSPRSVANLAWALSRLGIRHIPLLQHLTAEAEGLLRVELLDGTDTAKASLQSGFQAQSFLPQELSNLMPSLARLGVRSSRLSGLVGRWVLRRCPPRHPRPASDARQGPRELGKAAHGVDQLSVRDASELLYALATMAKHNVSSDIHNFGPSSFDVSDVNNVNTSSWPGDKFNQSEAASRMAIEALAGILNHAFLQTFLGENKLGGRPMPSHPGGPQLLVGGPQLLVGSVWALSRLDAPEAGGLWESVLRSLEKQSSEWSPSKLDKRKPLEGNQLGFHDVSSDLVPLAALQPEDVARLCWTLASNGITESHREADRLEGQPSSDVHQRQIRRLRVLRVLETEAIEWASSMDDQVMRNCVCLLRSS